MRSVWVWTNNNNVSENYRHVLISTHMMLRIRVIWTENQPARLFRGRHLYSRTQNSTEPSRQKALCHSSMLRIVEKDRMWTCVLAALDVFRYTECVFDKEINCQIKYVQIECHNSSINTWTQGLEELLGTVLPAIRDSNRTNESNLLERITQTNEHDSFIWLLWYLSACV